MLTKEELAPPVPASTIKFNNWRDRLIQGSFRGARFYVSNHKYTFGRRTQVYEQWKSDYAVVRDWGGKAEYWEIECYVIANKDNNFDHWPERLQLLKALKKGGWGILMHPYIGKLWVQVYGEQELSEDVETGGMSIFRLKFVQSRAPLLLPDTLSPLANVDAAARRAKDKVKDSVTTVMSNSSSLYKDSLLDGIKNILATMSTGLSRMKNVLSSAINEAQNFIAASIATIDQYLDTPCELMNQLEAAADQFKNIVGMGEDSINDLIEGKCSGLIYDGSTVLDGSEIPQETGDSVINGILDPVLEIDATAFGNVVSIQQDNASVIASGVQIILLSVITEIMIRTDYVTRGEYENALSRIADKFEEILALLGQYKQSTDMYQAAEDLRGIFFDNATARIIDTGTETIYKVPPRGTTALNVAYNRYGNLSRAGDIMKLNAGIVTHPGFLPPGEELRILDE